MSFSNQVFKNSSTGQMFDIFKEPQGDLIPIQNGVFDLGSNVKKWQEAYINNILIGSSTNSLNIYFQTTINANLATIRLIRLGDTVYGSITGGTYNFPNNIFYLALTQIPLSYYPSTNQAKNFNYFASITGTTEYLHLGAVLPTGGNIWSIVLYKNLGTPFLTGDGITWQNIIFSYTI